MGEDSTKPSLEQLNQLFAQMSQSERAAFLQQQLGQASNALAAQGGTAATGNGIAVGQTGQFNLYLDGKKEPSGDPERAYLTRLLRETDDLPLEGVDPEAKANPSLRMRLRAVYTGLTVAGYRPEEKKRGRSKRVAEPLHDERQISALEALGEERRLVLLGHPGGGKSTFVNFVAHCLAGELLGDAEANLETLRSPLPEDDGSDGKEKQPFGLSGLLPLRIILRDFAASKLVKGEAEDLWLYLQQKLAKALASDQEEMLRARLEQGTVLVLLDGLDEVPEPQKLRKKLVASVSAFEASFSRCRYVVTSRVDPYRNQRWELAGFEVAELAPFSDGQIRSFLRRWYEHAAALRPNRFAEAPEVRASWLERAIFRTRNLRELAGRPLLLTLMAAVHAWRGKLPDDRQQLYEEMVELLLERWEDRFERGDDQKRLLDQPELKELAGCSKEQLRRTLEELAFKAHAEQEKSEGTADIRAGALLEALRKAGRGAGNATALVDYLKLRAGLLIEREEDIFTFPHRSFQEYLAACHLLDQRPRPIEELVPEDFDRWREVVLLAAAKKRSTSRVEVWDLIGRLCPRNAQNGMGDRASEWRARLAGQIVAECFVAKGDLENLAEHDSELLRRVKEWQLALLRSDHLPSLERHRAGLVLGELGDPRFDPGCDYLPAEENLGFVEVPPGKFLMGSDREVDPLAFEDEMPQHEVDLPGFWLGRYPVTVAQFGAFVKDSGYSVEGNAWAAGAPHTPVVHASAYDAEAYCEWLGQRLRKNVRQGALSDLFAAGWRVVLPSEEQWERAARGGRDSIYPWEGAYNPDLLNSYESGIFEASVVGLFWGGRSGFQVEEMSGNTWEWTSSIWRKNYSVPSSENESRSNALRVVRGGAFVDVARYVRCAARYCLRPRSRRDGVGFRVALAPFSVP